MSNFFLAEFVIFQFLITYGQSALEEISLLWVALQESALKLLIKELKKLAQVQLENVTSCESNTFQIFFSG